MKLLRRIVFIVIVLALLVVLFQNQAALGRAEQFNFLHWSFSLVLGFWILFAFAAGAALFALIDAWKGLVRRYQIRQRDQRIAQLEAEVATLRREAPRPLSAGDRPAE
jgi:uncharacterized integral membrane protein